MYTETQEPQARVGTSGAADVVKVLLGELGRDERLFVILRHSEGLEIEEIAAAMRCTEESVRAGLARVEARIQQLLAVPSEPLTPAT